jgi:general stress protein 26
MRAEILHVMDHAEAVHLATVDGAAPRIRAMVNLRRADLGPGPSAFCRAEGFSVYFATSAASGKIRDVRANPAASAYFAIPHEYHGVLLAGEAEVLDAPALKRTLWNEGWRIYWSGPDDPDYVDVRLTPRDVTGWWHDRTFRFDPAAA